MVKFSKQFEGQPVPQWEEAFVDYWKLKKDLKKIHLLNINNNINNGSCHISKPDVLDSSNTDTIQVESTANSDESIPVDVTQDVESVEKRGNKRMVNKYNTLSVRDRNGKNVVARGGGKGFSLHILGHRVGNRLEQERFQHYGKTVSRYFGQVFDVVCCMAMDIIKPQDSNFRDIPEEILTESTYMPHFKDYIGVIDGTHIPVSIFPEDQIPYIGRKGIPTQNVMAACDFKIQFIFAVAC
ncbi:hypothetical protein Ddye_013211 [Dipteronia dyeriana]|uniref:SPX domain-containing protein n=1 Tax=Dipteronia dyeriana TaxID=168575 RepID=A0AAD9X5Q9_9ROSI|nr:hypothetical protein Ddye_013211 [Dipteronia dyeriana]